MGDLARAVSRMLGVFGQASADRVEVYLEAVREEGFCEACAAAACRRLVREGKRRPTPADLLEATRSELATAAHRAHVGPRPALPRGEEGWWEAEGARIVRRWWPELSERDLGLVLAELRREERLGLLSRDEASIVSSIGWEDERGPTAERRWFERYLAWRRS